MAWRRCAVSRCQDRKGCLTCLGGQLTRRFLHACGAAQRALDGALRARRGGAANSEATTGAATGAQIGIGSDEASAPASIAAEAKPKTVAAAGDYSAKVEAESAASRRVFDTSAGVDFNAEKETVNGAPPRDFLDVDGLKDNSEATDDAPDGGDIEGTRRLLENIRGVEAKRGTSGGAGGSYEPPEEIEATRVPFDNGPVDSELLASDLAGPRKLPASGLYLPKADPRKEIFDTEHPHPVESDSSESEEERQSTGGWGLRGALSRLLRRKSFDVPTPPSELESEFSSEPAPSAPPAAADREEAAAPPAVGVAAATSPTNSTKKRVRSLPRPRSVYPEDGYVRRATTLGAKPGAVGVLSLLAVETAVGVARVAITAALAAANGSEEVKPSRGPAADPQMDEAKNKAP